MTEMEKQEIVDFKQQRIRTEEFANVVLPTKVKYKYRRNFKGRNTNQMESTELLDPKDMSTKDQTTILPNLKKESTNKFSNV